MRRVLVTLAVLAIGLFAAPSNAAFAQSPPTSLKFLPPAKHVVLLLSSYAETNVDTDLAVGQAVANERRAQGFKVPVTRTVGRVNLWLKKSGTPTDNLTVEIRTDSGGLPSGTLVTNAVSLPVAGSSIGDAYDWVAFDFEPSVPLPRLTAGVQYHLVLKRSGPVDAANYYLWGADQSSPGYGDGAGSVFGGSWAATSPATDHAFEVRPTFTVDVYVKDVVTRVPCDPYYPEPCGLGAYTIRAQFNPALIRYVSIVDGPFLTSTGRLAIMCGNVSGHNPAAGAVAYTCVTSGNPPGYPPPPGPNGSGVLAVLTFIPLASGVSSLGLARSMLLDVPAELIPHTAESGSVTVGNYGSADSDGDGCADIEETGDDPALGGDRNPVFAWDFFDVPVPARADPAPNGPKNKAVGMEDVLAVLTYAGTYLGGPRNPGGVDYDSDKGIDTNGDTIPDIPPDGVPDGRDYDRAPSWPFTGAPDNSVSMSDVLAALAQAGHSCVAPP